MRLTNRRIIIIIINESVLISQLFVRA